LSAQSAADAINQEMESVFNTSDSKHYQATSSLRQARHDAAPMQISREEDVAHDAAHAFNRELESFFGTQVSSPADEQLVAHKAFLSQQLALEEVRAREAPQEPSAADEFNREFADFFGAAAAVGEGPAPQSGSPQDHLPAHKQLLAQQLMISEECSAVRCANESFLRQMDEFNNEFSEKSA